MRTPRYYTHDGLRGSIHRLIAEGGRPVPGRVPQMYYRSGGYEDQVNGDGRVPVCWDHQSAEKLILHVQSAIKGAGWTQERSWEVLRASPVGALIEHDRARHDRYWERAYEPKPSLTTQEIEDAVVALLRGAPAQASVGNWNWLNLAAGEMTQNGLVKAVPERWEGNVRKLLPKMVERGVLSREKRGKGNGAWVYRLTEGELCKSVPSGGAGTPEAAPESWVEVEVWPWLRQHMDTMDLADAADAGEPEREPTDELIDLDPEVRFLLGLTDDEPPQPSDWPWDDEEELAAEAAHAEVASRTRARVANLLPHGEPMPVDPPRWLLNRVDHTPPTWLPSEARARWCRRTQDLARDYAADAGRSRSRT